MLLRPLSAIVHHLCFKRGTTDEAVIDNRPETVAFHESAAQLLTELSGRLIVCAKSISYVREKAPDALPGPFHFSQRFPLFVAQRVAPAGQRRTVGAYSARRIPAGGLAHDVERT
jgi:hypothetical protein